MLEVPSVFEWSHNLSSSAVVFFFAGRIDDRKNALLRVGAREDISDETLVFHTYQRFGQKCTDHLVGDFAFAIWDPEKRLIFAARDPAGCQPAFFHSNSERFAIAESIEQLLTVPGVGRDLDESFIATSLNRIFTHPERTFYKEIRKVKPGHSVTVTQGNTPAQNRYWFPERIPKTQWDDPAERDEAFRVVVQQAVQDRIPPKGRVGVHVSGGLDCSTVAAYAAQALRERGRPAPLAFSWQPESWEDEDSKEELRSEYARIDAICKQESLPINFCSLTKVETLNLFRRDNAARPLCGGSYGEWMVQREAEKRNVSVILSGWGGDEFASFNGRGAIPGMAIRGRWATVFRHAKKSGKNPLRALAGAMLLGLQHAILPEWFLDPYWRDKNYLRLPAWKAILRTLFPRLRKSDQLLNVHQKEKEFIQTRSYIDDDFQKRVKPLPDWPVIRQTSTRRVRYQLWRQGHLATRIESWAADGSARGIRYAYPLLDRRVMEFVLALPEDVYDDGVTTRLFFRRAMEPVLPKEICWNLNDVDPARIGAMQKAVLAAFVEIGERLEKVEPPPLAAYLDLPRLIRDLKPESLESRSGFGKLFFALQLLGSEGTGSDESHESE